MAKNKIIKQLRHGQITIPKELREALGLEDDDVLSISLAGDKLEIEPLKVAPKTAGSPWARELYKLFAPVRKSLEGYSEEEINEGVEKALREVRSEKG
jgi:AbrB family looped-hinge helix DNA binding protein